jgi:PHD/YefM family antitoxin component YafN of YafNO toxin-antitoxin module
MITRHGQEVVVVVSADEFHRLTDPEVSLGEYLIQGPRGDDLEIIRDRTPARIIEFDDLP